MTKRQSALPHARPAGEGVRILRGPYATLKADPFLEGSAASLHHESDGAIVIAEGHIQATGPAGSILPVWDRDDCQVIDYRGGDRLILPGFIDCHVHYPQLQMIGSHGVQLIDWLQRYTFPVEQAFADEDHARETAAFFIQQMLRAGTTTAAVFCTIHPHSVDALFTAAARLNLRMIAGKVMMDRNAPPGLMDTAESAWRDSRHLIEKWHGKGRALYALTPRFAPTSTPAQLEAAGSLRRDFPDVYVQSHLSENRAEIDWVLRLFPKRAGYLDVYDHYGLIGPRSIYGHCLHLTAAERRRMQESRTAIAFCPTSNLFLGSGLLDLRQFRENGCSIPVGLATDVGGGTSLSLLQTLNEAYKVSQMAGASLDAVRGLHLITRGAAESLCLQDRIGSIAPGMEADFTILDLRSTPLISWRMDRVESLAEALFVQMTMADDRAVLETWAAGQPVYRRVP